MTMSFNRVDPTDPNSNTAAIQLTSKDIPEEELTLIENELKSEIEKVNKAHQDYNDKKNKVLQSNPPQGPSADYGADMWKLFDVYSRAGQLFALRFYENKLAIVHSELQPCLTQIEEIKKFKQDKENKGEQLSHVEIDDIEQRLNKIKARMEVLANISRKVTGEPDKDGNAATLSDSSYALQAAGTTLSAPRGVYDYVSTKLGGGCGAKILGGVCGLVGGGLVSGVAAPLAFGVGAVGDMLGGVFEAATGINVGNMRALGKVELETNPLNAHNSP